ncbi:MAG: VOC family protein [Lachnospiraceae bacterium]|nr:VOC family protein [Lachnospiraceae bacterium]
MKNLITGLQHLGLPTKDYDATLKFYEGLGFEVIYSTINGSDKVAFLKIGDFVIETYEMAETAGINGAIDHIALNVTDIESAFEKIKAGSYEMLDTEINYLPFFEKGVRYFTIIGPNAEKVEFNQILS